MSHDSVYNPCVVLEQVPNATGWAQGRWIDVAVFQMWASKGLTRSAFEIKVSRSDFIAEMSNTEKHKWCKECFHYFWFVAPKDIIKLEELPNGIGLMCPRGDKLVISRNAIKNENPKLDDYLLAAFMRASNKQIKKAEQLTRGDILANDSGHQTATRYLQATTAFLQSRGKDFWISDTVMDITKALEEATMDQQLVQDRDHLLAISARFQREIASLLNVFIIIASKSLTARDGMGKYIISTYGGSDSEGLQALEERAGAKNATEHEKRYAQVINLMLNWEKEFPH
jgi:hypothetical protein